MKAQEPVACPFCGSENAAPYSVKSCHSVLCVACGGEGPEADSEESAIAAWNRRAHPPAGDDALLLQALEALEAQRTMLDIWPSPRKFDEALSWRENDIKAREMVDAAISALKQRMEKP